MKKHIIFAEIVAAILVAVIFAVVCGREGRGAPETNAPPNLQAPTADQSGAVDRAQARANEQE